MGSPRRRFLEIQTLGDRGLRYRNRMRGTTQSPEWKVLDANDISEVVDTCGAGDWCTAGFIHSICQKGPEALREAARADVEEALQFGQALAAWNCGFEGARGSMYRVDKAGFERQVKQILRGSHPGNTSGTVVDRTSKIAGRICPACEKTPNPHISPRV